MIENLTPKKLAEKLTDLFKRMDDNIHLVISKGLADPQDTESDLLYPPDLLEEIYSLYSHSAGTNHLREHLREYRVKLSLPEKVEILEKAAFPYTDSLRSSFYIDLGNSRYGIFEREQAKKVEIHHLATYPFVLDVRQISQAISESELRASLDKISSWVKEFEQFYGEPYDTNDNISSVVGNIASLPIYRAIIDRQY